MENGLVSVVVPIYNVEKYLDRCINLLHRISVKPFLPVWTRDFINLFRSALQKYTISKK